MYTIPLSYLGGSERVWKWLWLLVPTEKVWLTTIFNNQHWHLIIVVSLYVSTIHRTKNKTCQSSDQFQVMLNTPPMLGLSDDTVETQAICPVDLTTSPQRDPCPEDKITSKGIVDIWPPRKCYLFILAYYYHVFDLPNHSSSGTILINYKSSVYCMLM